MTISTDQLAHFIDQLWGVSLPDVVLGAIVSQVNSIEACLIGAGYPADKQTLILFYAGAILAGSTGGRQIKSQGAPNGASRSFDIPANALSGLRSTLLSMDTSKCTAAILPPAIGVSDVLEFGVKRA